jgi:excisionase family DNA binding protein
VTTTTVEDGDRMYPPAEAAARLGVSVSKLYRLITDGRINAVRLGDRPGSAIRVPASALDDFINTHRTY